MIDGWGISCKIVLILMSLDLTDYQSTLVRLMAWWSGNKPLPEPMLTEICRHMASLCHNELKVEQSREISSAILGDFIRSALRWHLPNMNIITNVYIDGLVQDCNISNVLATEWRYCNIVLSNQSNILIDLKNERITQRLLPLPHNIEHALCWPTTHKLQMLIKWLPY